MTDARHFESDTPWKTRPQAARYVGLTSDRLAHLACTGLGPKFHRTPSGSIRYHVRDLDAWMGLPVSSTTEADSRDRSLSAA